MCRSAHEELVDQLRDTDPQLVDSAARELDATLLVGLPEDAKLPRGLKPVSFPTSEPAAEGKRHTHVNWPADLSTFTADTTLAESVSGTTARAMRIDDVVGLFTWRDGTRQLVGRDGSVLEMEARQWFSGDALADTLDQAVSEDLHIPMPDREVTFKRMGLAERSAIGFARAANTKPGLIVLISLMLLLTLWSVIGGHRFLAFVLLVLGATLGAQLWRVEGGQLGGPAPAVTWSRLTPLVPRTTLRDSRTLQWSECGLPDGVPVVFLHGCPDTRRASWSGHEAARRAGVRLLAANRPGYGASTPAAPSYHQVVDDVAELADSLGLEQFAVLGMSVGGTFALACAALLPDRVTHATLVGTPGEAPRMDPAYPRDDLDESARAFFDSLASGTPEENLQRVRPDFLALACRMSIRTTRTTWRWPRAGSPRCRPRTGPSSTGRRRRSPRRRARRSAPGRLPVGRGPGVRALAVPPRGRPVPRRPLVRRARRPGTTPQRRVAGRAPHRRHVAGEAGARTSRVPGALVGRRPRLGRRRSVIRGRWVHSRAAP